MFVTAPPTEALELLYRDPLHPVDGVDNGLMDTHEPPKQGASEGAVFVVLGLVFCGFCVCMIVFVMKTKRDSKHRKEYHDVQFRAKENTQQHASNSSDGKYIISHTRHDQ